MFQKDTITATSHTEVTAKPLRTVVSTDQNNIEYQPFMIAFDIESGNHEVNLTAMSLNISAYVSEIEGEIGVSRKE